VEDFLHINLGNVLTIIAFIVGGLAFVYTLRSDIEVHAQRIQMIADRFGIVEVKMERLSEVVVALARQEERLLAMDQRMLAQGARIDDLSRRLGIESNRKRDTDRG